ncbi:class F sortase [Micromonospora sp. GCM10011542]|uniref:class F sortase n=1 Tax=Micromonospora sp. GCM10011542 TaxID=3317337 RepID=UPI00360EDAE3
MEIFRPASPPAGSPPGGSPPVASRPPTAVAPRRSRPPGRSPWSVPLAVVLVLVGVFATGAGLGRSVDPLDWAAAGGDRPSRSESVGLSASRPIRLSVPSIRIAAPVAPVGQAADGSIAVPPLERHNETGWYDRGPTPGEPGPAVIVGHVDTKSGPSVFHDLGKVRPGDLIEVTRADRSVVVFRVDTVEHFPKDRLPAERIYGHDGPPGLRLITCGGDWVGGRTGYADNIIVFAAYQSARQP